MSFCVMGAVVIPVAIGSVKESRDLVGSMSRAFNGSARYDLRAQKRKWTLRTTPMSSTAYASMLAAIDVSTGAVAMSGDIVGTSTNVFARVTGADVVEGKVAGTWVDNLRICDLEITEV